ncbi:MAG: PAS domain S-box protein [Terriglobales bacterium]
MAFQSGESSQLMHSFCRLARIFFGANDCFLWSRTAPETLLGADADGDRAMHFQGTSLRAETPSIVWEAVHKRRALVIHAPDLNPDLARSLATDLVAEPESHSVRDPFLGGHGVRTAMAAPLLVGGEAIGAIACTRNRGSAFDNNDLAKVTMLATQLGAAIEAIRLNRFAQDEHRRATVLVELANAMHTLPDASAVMERVADRLRALLQSPAVLIFVQHERLFQLQAVSTEAPRLAQIIRRRAGEHNLRSALEIATRAVTAGERITVNVDCASHFGEDLAAEVGAGALVAAPFRTSRSYGAILVYPRASEPFTQEDKALVSALAGLGAMAVANAELYGMTRAQAQELHEMLEISGELRSAGKVDEFMRKSVVRSARFLGFERCFIGLLEDGKFRVRWGFEKGAARALDIPLYEGEATQNLQQKKVFCAEDLSTVPGANQEFVGAFNIKQLLVVPLLGSGGNVLGMFGVLDRVESGPINNEDIRRAQALAAQIAIEFELTQNLQDAEQQRRRTEALVTLALELNTVLHLPEFMRNFALRAGALLDGRAVALSLFETAELETVLMCGASELDDKPLVRRLAEALRSALPKYTSDISFAPAVELLGSALASSLGWTDCTLVRLAGTSGELVGVLCLANRGSTPSPEDSQLMRAIAGHASIALENARLFTRMQQANRHWTDVFDAISDYIVVHDEHHNILRVNRSLAQLIGLEPEQLIGINMRALDALTTGTAPHSCPFCRSGEGLDEYVHPALERIYLISTSRIHSATPETQTQIRGSGDTQGANVQMQTVHVLKDITDRREAERRYRELFNNIQEGIYVSTPNGRFIEVNDALVRILGYDSREEVLQLDIATSLYFSPHRRQELVEELRTSGEMHNHEEVLRRKDGSPVHVYMNCYAMRDAGGGVVQHRGLMLDITGLRQSQTELQKERDFSGKILSHTQSLILVTDTEGIVSYANRRWSSLGFQQSHVVGHSFLEFCAEPRREALRQALIAVARGQQVDNFDLPLVRNDGASGQFTVNLSPIGEDGKVTSIVVVMTDVTDSAILRSKLVHAEKMAAVGQLVSGVAHEVNNPLTAILGFTDLLMENPELPESARHDLRVILQEAQRTKQIVQNLLSFARQMPPRRQPVQLNSILKRTVQLRSYDFISHGIQVLEKLDESLPEIVGDSHQLQQVFLNILNNAYDAVRECGRPARIEIMSARTENSVEVLFRDNGSGIADPARIFDPFFTTKDVGKGTGLGLSICYGIVHEHGGEILCHNNPESEGATFVVRLPLAADAASLGAAAGVYPK